MSEDQDQIKQLKIQLADAHGRIKAVELSAYEIKRNAEKATAQASALQAETEAAMITAADQLKTAHAIACGIFGMAELSRAYMARKVAAARVVHRESKQMEMFQQFIDGIEKNDRTSLEAVISRAKQNIEAVKKDNEASRNAFYDHAQAYGYKLTQDLWVSLMKEVA